MLFVPDSINKSSENGFGHIPIPSWCWVSIELVILQLGSSNNFEHPAKSILRLLLMLIGSPNSTSFSSIEILSGGLTPY